MSRQNKVNPGMYTQRGRLTPDDAARELARQRSIGSRHTWQPIQRDRRPKLSVEPDHSEPDGREKGANSKRLKPVAASKSEPAKSVRKNSAAKPAAKAASRKTATAARASGRGKAKTPKPSTRSARRRPPAKRDKS